MPPSNILPPLYVGRDYSNFTSFKTHLTETREKGFDYSVLPLYNGELGHWLGTCLYNANGEPQKQDGESQEEMVDREKMSIHMDPADTFMHVTDWSNSVVGAVSTDFTFSKGVGGQEVGTISLTRTVGR